MKIYLFVYLFQSSYKCDVRSCVVYLIELKYYAVIIGTSRKVFTERYIIIVKSIAV